MENPDYVPPTVQEFEDVLQKNGFVRSVLESRVFKHEERQLRVSMGRDELGPLAYIEFYDVHISSPQALQGKLNNIFVEELLES